MTHNPENEIDFTGSGYCRTCRTYWDYLEFHGCTCCEGAAASCWNDECDGVIERTSERDHSPRDGWLSDARRESRSRISRQRDAVRAGVL